MWVRSLLLTPAKSGQKRSSNPQKKSRTDPVTGTLPTLQPAIGPNCLRFLNLFIHHSLQVINLFLVIFLRARNSSQAHARMLRTTLPCTSVRRKSRPWKR